MNIKRKFYRNLNQQMDKEFDATIYLKHEFSEEYSSKKAALIEKAAEKQNIHTNQESDIIDIPSQKSISFYKKYPILAKISVCVAGVIVCTTTVFATEQLRKSKLNDVKVANYEVDLVMEKGDDSQGKLITGITSKTDQYIDSPNGKIYYNSKEEQEYLEGRKIPNQDRYIKLDVEKLPSTVRVMCDSPFLKEYHISEGGMIIDIFDMRKIDNKSELKNLYTTSINKMDINGNDALFLEKDSRIYDLADSINWNKKIYIFFEEYDTIVSLYANTKFSKDDMLNIAENIMLSEGNRYDCMYFSNWDDLVEDYSVGNYYELIDKKYVKLHDMADGAYEMMTVPLNLLDNYIKNDSPYSISCELKDIQISDNLNDIGILNINNNDSILNNKLQGFMDDDRNLLPDRLLYIKRGDGISTLDSIVADVAVDMKIVYATFDITNNSSEDFENVFLLFSPINLKEEGEQYIRTDFGQGQGLEPTDQEYDYVLNAAHSIQMDYPVYSDYDSSINIPAGETKTVHVAYCVDECDLETFYIKTRTNINEDDCQNYIKVIQ